MKLLAGLLLICCILLASCNEKQERQKIISTAKAGALIPIDFADTNYYETLSNNVEDTVTKDGWSIKYFVKNDSTRYTDLYIKWSKGKKNGIFDFPEVLTLRPMFIPQLAGENASYIFMTYACATECKALVTLSKNNPPAYQDFVSVINYDIKTSRIVYLSYGDSTTEVSVHDLKRNIGKSVEFKNVCDVPPENICVDSVYFSPNYVRLSGTFADKKHKNKTIKEMHVVKFD